MENLELHSNIYGLNPNKPVFGRTTAAKTTNSIKFKGTNDRFEKKVKNNGNDGKFSFWEFGKNVIKGSEEFFTDIYKGIVKNPLSSIAMIAGSLAIAATPAGLMFLTGVGLSAGLFSLTILGLKTIDMICGKKWDELEKQGKDYGKLIPSGIISSFGAIKGVRQMEHITGATKTTKFTALNKAATIGNHVSWNLFKNCILAPYRAAKKFIFKKPVEEGILIEKIKLDHKAFADKLTISKGFTEKEVEYIKNTKFYGFKPENIAHSAGASVNKTPE